MKKKLPYSFRQSLSGLSLQILTLIALLAPGIASAQGGASSQSLWKDVKEVDITAESNNRLIVPSKYVTKKLNVDAMRNLLLTAPDEPKNLSGAVGTEIHLPMPNGTFGRFMVWYSPIMAPELAAKFPEIRTYCGVNLDNKANIIRLDLTPAGFHAMTYGGGEPSVFIDPYAKGNTTDYTVYNRKDFVKKFGDQVYCSVGDGFTVDLKDHHDFQNNQEFVGDCGIRHEYRLAVSATGEYSAFHGGTTALALAAITTTMNRVNGVFEKDISSRMNLIGNNNLIIYLNAATDPFTNGTPGLMINENQTNTDAVIGNANYDIGHVFGTNSGGLAGLGVVCSGGNKARGVTGSGAPIGDPFDIDYVAHEMGHQFNGNHTQYNDGCNRNNATAIEPGSASTIMGYAGICPPDIQSNSDAYFSTASLFEMRPFVATGGGSTCDNAVAVVNTSPTVSGLSNYSIPISTPFVLTASATDAEGGSLTYCWEQTNNWQSPTQTMPPAAGNLHGPMFRSLTPVASPTRYFPNLTDLFANVNPTWEELSSIGRTMNFRVTVRDNFATAGCTGEASNTVTTVAGSGPFLVTSPNTAVTYAVGSTQTVTWDVANTTAAPVSCANVDILFTSDGGANFTTLLANTPNDGSQAVTMPNMATNTGRIVVKCSNNIFFDVSNVNFRLVGPIVINEVDYDMPGADGAEFIELKNISGAAVNLNGWTVELVNGNGGGAAIYSTITLPNVNLAAGDYFVICGNAANTPNCDLDVTPNTDLVQNGPPDAIGLRNAGVLVDAVSYEGNTGAPYTESNGTGLIDGAAFANQGISRFPDGTDTDVNNVDFLSNVCISPGLPNLNTTTGCVLPCVISAITFSNVGACNDNGTNSNSSDDYFTADITVTYVNPPASGNLTLTGDVLAGGGALTVAAPFNATTTVFTGVRLKADGTASTVTATFSADGCTFTVTDGPNVPSCSVPSCSLTDAGLTNVHCEDNNGTSGDNTDDFIWFQLNPMGTALGTGYNVTVNVGTVMLNGNMPATNVPYGVSNTFRLQQGSAGGGNVMVTITDASNPSCVISVTIIDPGACSSVTCSLMVTCPPQPTGTYSCTNPVPPGVTTLAGFQALGGDATGMFCGTLTITFVTTDINNCSSSEVIRTYTIFDDLAPFNGVRDAGENYSTCTLTYAYTPDTTPPVFNESPLPADLTIGCTDPLPLPEVLTGSDNCGGGTVPPVIWINEIHYDNTGGDVGEFVEVAGTAGINLADYQIILYNGNGGVVYDTDPLVGVIDNEGSGFGAVSLGYAANGIQNGAPDGIALYQISTNMVVQFLSYEGVFQALDGPANGMVSTNIPVLELGTEPVGLSLQLTGTGQVAADFSWVGPLAQSPGTLNAGQTINALPPSIPATFMQTEAPGTCDGARIVTRTWTVTDICGNSVVHTQTINVNDTEDPVLTPTPADITLNCDAALPPVPNVVATDLCDPAGIVNGPVWINEIHYDNNGGDVNEFIEIAGRAGTNLSGYELFLYNGSTGMMGGTYASLPLSGVIPDQSNGFGTIAFFFPPDGIQNGPSDGIAFVDGGTVLQFLSYEGVMTAIGGPANGMTSIDIGVAELGSELPGQSVRLSGNGATYGAFVWNGPSAAFPATPGQVNQGQTFPVQPPIGLDVTFTETNMAGTCAQNRIIKRTWMTSDDCGNTAVYTQTISLGDLAGPNIVCANITVNLDIFGNVSVPQSQLIQSLSDGCAPNSSITITPAGPFTFTCLHQGTTQSVTLTATDPCGNSSSCTATITINPFERCTPKILITDPCICKNNGTNLMNGQFGEEIKVESLAGQVWRVVSSTGLYLSTSPAPPNAPLAIPFGTLLVESPVGSGDYYLNGIHVDNIGYTVTVQNNLGQSLTIGNKCAYPNPEITADLSGDFCLFSDPVQLTGTPGDANFISEGFTINGVPATEFDPSVGVGTYVIVYTVDGGTPKAFGPDDPGCVEKITVTLHVVETPDVLNCNDLIYVSLDATCTGEIRPDDVLEGSYGCFDDYLVELDKTLPLGNGPWVPAILTVADVGKTYQTRVTHLVSGNKCWGSVLVQDKIAPQLECEDIHLNCAVTTYDPNYLDNVLGIDNATPTVTECSNYDLTYVDTWFDLACGASINGVSDVSAYVQRKWTAVDQWGNSSTCLQYLYFERRHVYDLHFPPEVTIPCGSNPNVDPSVTGAPYLEEFGLEWPIYPTGGFCEMQSAYVDQILPVCDGTYKILRMWTILDWCLPTTNTPPLTNPLYYLQLIKVVDESGPAFTCPPNTTVSIDPFNCCATVDMPDRIIEDACSRVNNIEGMVVTYDQYTGEQNGMYTFGGSLEDFAGNNWWDRDTMGNWGVTPCLPMGSHVVTYRAYDDCSNVRTCTFRLVVADLIPPVASCDQTTVVAINHDDPYDCYEPTDGCDGAGVTSIPASVFNDGSYDACGNLKMTVRRMSPYSDCINNLSHEPCYPNGQSEYDLAIAERDSVKFYCCEVGTIQTVILRVYQIDVNGNIVNGLDGTPIYNECMIQVEVQEKVKPICQPPANVTTTCESFDPSLWLYGKAEIFDNCCLDTTKVYQEQCGLTHAVSYTQFDTLCNKGTITRTFRAFDCHGNSSQCTQRIVVNYEQDYYVRFPNDVIVSVCDGTGNYGEPTFYGEDCELLGVSFEDEIFTVVPDACYKIERTWKIINWCTYNNNNLCIDVPNPNPNATTNHPTNLPGPIVSPVQTVGDPWKSTIVKVNPSDALATNYSSFYNPNANCYRYKQIIKVIDTQDPVAQCPASPVTICDLTANDAQLWNETYWWDNGNQSHDLCEAPSDICLTATDACSGSNINFEYQLFLDLDGDGVMETVVNSTQLGTGQLGWNNILYGNVTGAGQSRQFDGRPVPANQKWGFAIQETVTGNNKTACVKFNTFQNQNAFVAPQLPHGNHKIKWFVTDGCGNETVCEYAIIVKDCKAPTVVCLNGLSVNIMPTGMIAMWATDFLQYSDDNCTQTPYIKFGIRKCDQGTGFPVDANGNPITSVTFTCDELGMQCVELWAIDLAGNADFCKTFILVQDNANNCSASNLAVSGSLKTELEEGIEEAEVALSVQVPFAPPLVYSFPVTDETGLFSFTNAVPLGSDYTIIPMKDDNPLNGVTTFDLVLITKHILGIEPLGSPYKMIAADANKSNSITTSDVVELRKLILGINQDLSNNTSWRFVDKAQVFSNPLNPFADVIAESISINDASADNNNGHFVGVKIGDVNNTVVAHSLMVTDDRTQGALLLDLSDRSVNAGEEFEVTFQTSEKAQGFQMTLNLNGLEVSEIVNGENVNANNFGIHKNALTVSLNGADAFTVKFKANKAGKLSQMMQLSSEITKAEAYSLGNGRMEVALRFDGKTIAGVGFELYQNQPNPFINKTAIGFHLPQASSAILTVYDETGRQVFTQKGDFASGYNSILLDRALLNSSGVLYYSLETDSHQATKKMIQSK